MTEAITGGIVGAIVAALATWLFRRSSAIEQFFLEASGATRALEKAREGKGKPANAEHLAGVVEPLADTLGLRVRRLDKPAREWAVALKKEELEQALDAQETFARKARFAGFGFPWLR